MSSFTTLSVVLALLLYVPLCVQLLQGKAKQNLATWIMWGSLDLIVTITIIVQHGNYFLPAAYVLGCGITLLCMIKFGDLVWTSFESFVAFLVLVCLIVWGFSGSKIATVASTLAMAIAGIPQLIDCYRRPHGMPFLIYIGYTVANLFSVLGGKNWSIEERFYPIMAGIYCLLFSALASRKFWVKQPT